MNSSRAGDWVLRAESICKAFPQRAGLRSLFSGARATDCRLALEGVSFDVEKGSALGVVGQNGAGKSTLLRVMAGLTKPTRGKVARRGRTACLLDLAAGLVDEWSGIENARAGLRLQGVENIRIEERLDEVDDFAELGRHWREPVRTYSAGMRLRLGYAIAVSGRPEIFLVDEILAVGDEAFARKCSLHVSNFLDQGGTLLLASHNLYQVEKLCSRAIWLHQGRVRDLGESREVTGAYREWVEALDCEPSVARAPAMTGPGRIRLIGPHVSSEAMEFPFAAEVEAAIDARGLEAADLAVEVRRHTGELVSRVSVPGSGRLALEGSNLLPGSYRMCLVAGTDQVGVADLRLVGDRRELGSVFLEHGWSQRGAP